MLRARFDQGLLVALVLAVAVRVGLFAYAAVWPITNEQGLPVSPLVVQNGIDFAFYRTSLNLYTDLSVSELADRLVDFYHAPFSQHAKYRISGPVLPGLIGLFDYKAGNTLPLASFYLLMSVALAALWLGWLAKHRVAAPWLLLFAVLPNPLWFMLNVSTDLPFALLAGLFYVSYFRPRWEARQVAAWLVLLLLLLATRPNSYALLLFVFLDLAWRQDWSWRARTGAATAAGVGLVVFGLYLFPYFFTTIKVTNTAPIYTYFGLHQTAYLEGLFDDLPLWLDRIFSVLSLAVAKVMYFVGLRPSYSGMEWWIVLARGAAGVIMLPGILYVALRGDGRHRLFLTLMALPVLIGPSQDRYNLPIQPLLFFFGVIAIERLSRRLSRRPAWLGSAATVVKETER